MIETHHIGEERHPVAVIDGFVPDIDALVEEASTLSFSTMGAFYPGVRATFSSERLASMLSPYQSDIVDVFGEETELHVRECAWSMVTTPAANLAPIQRLPHVDGTDQTVLAVLVYLTGERFGGTAFYRHRATGFERLSDDRYPKYAQALQAEVRKSGLPPAAYVTGDTPIYEQIARFDAKPGRALVYSGTNLHSGLITNADALVADPAKGRLTINGFVRFGSETKL